MRKEYQGLSSSIGGKTSKRGLFLFAATLFVSGFFIFNGTALAATHYSTSLAVTAVTDTYGNTVSLTATLTRTSNGRPVRGKSIIFELNGNNVGSAVTNSSGIATKSGVSLVGINVGSYSSGIDASFTGDTTGNSRYDASSGTASLTVNKRAITVTAAAKSKTYGDVDPALTYQITSGSLVSGDSFSGALTRAAGNNIGTYAIQQGTLALSGNYTLTYVGANLTINKRAITVKASTNSKEYDGIISAAAIPTITSGTLATGDTANFTETYSNENVGTSKTLIPSGTVSDGNGGNNYNVTLSNNTTGVITARAITVTADVKTKVYGDVDPALTYQVTSGFLVSGDSLTGALTRVAGVNVGTYAIQKGTLANSNYSITYVGANLTITAKPITVTADAKSKIYGAVDPALTYQITSGSLVGSDNFSGALSRTAGEDIGKYAINQNTLALSGNYTLTFVSADFEITAKTLTVTVEGQDKVYDGTTAATVTLSTGVSGVTADYANASFNTKDADTQKTINVTGITLSGDNAGNYDFNNTASATADITAKPITVTADSNQSKIYGATDPTLTYQIPDGSLASGDSSLTGALTRAPGVNVGTYAIQQGTVNNSNNSNYDITFVGADFSIIKATPQINWSNPDGIIYGIALSITQLNAVLASVIEGAWVYDPATGTILNAGTGRMLSVIFTPADINNYNTASSSVAINVAKADQTIDFVALGEKTYGEEDFTVSATASSTLPVSFTASGDTCTVSADNKVHIIKAGTCTITAHQDGNGNHNNYNAAPEVSQSFTINKRPLTVSATADSKPYDGTTDPTSTGIPTITLGSLAEGDSVIWTQIFDNEDAGSGKILTPSGTVSDGNGGNNYDVTFVPAAGEITPRVIGVTANAKSKTYGNDDPALNYQVTGSLVAPDNFTGVLSRNPGEDVSTYAIGQGTLALNTNYTINFTGASLEITEFDQTINVIVGAKSKTYGAPDPELTYTFNPSLKAGDEFTGALNRDPGEDVGTYAIIKDTLTAGINYVLNFTGANLTITPAPITVTADSQSKTYGDVDPALTYQITGGALVGSDELSGSLARAEGKNVGIYAIGQGSLTAGTNYNLNFLGANLTITEKDLAIAANDAIKTVGQTLTFDGTEFTASGLTNEDSITSVTLISDGAGESATAGTYDIVPSVAVGTGLGNYKIIYTNDGNLTGNTKNKPRDLFGRIQLTLLIDHR